VAGGTKIKDQIEAESSEQCYKTNFSCSEALVEGEDIERDC
jgi:hypothetical protein